MILETLVEAFDQFQARGRREEGRRRGGRPHTQSGMLLLKISLLFVYVAPTWKQATLCIPPSFIVASSQPCVFFCNTSAQILNLYLQYFHVDKKGIWNQECVNWTIKNKTNYMEPFCVPVAPFRVES